MKDFYIDMGFIVGFLILIILMKSFFGEKWADRFLIATLLSMLILNHEKIKRFIQDKFL